MIRVDVDHVAVMTSRGRVIVHLPVPRLGDIGEPKRNIELEPFPEQAPATEPAAPATVPDAEPVPA